MSCRQANNKAKFYASYLDNKRNEMDKLNHSLNVINQQCFRKLHSKPVHSSSPPSSDSDQYISH